MNSNIIMPLSFCIHIMLCIPMLFLIFLIRLNNSSLSVLPCWCLVSSVFISVMSIIDDINIIISWITSIGLLFFHFCKQVHARRYKQQCRYLIRSNCYVSPVYALQSYMAVWMSKSTAAPCRATTAAVAYADVVDYVI